MNVYNKFNIYIIVFFNMIFRSIDIDNSDCIITYIHNKDRMDYRENFIVKNMD